MRRFILPALILSISCLVVLSFHVAYTTRTTYRSASISGACRALENVLDALNRFRDVNGRFPDRIHTALVDGNRIEHSWRALLLPYITTERVASTYNVNAPVDDPHNVEAANRIFKFSAISGVHDACVFMISDSEVHRMLDKSDYVESCVVAVAIPFQTCPWATSRDMTSGEVWDICQKDPDVVFVGFLGGCVVRMSNYVSSREECIALLTNREDLRPYTRAVHERIVASTSIDGRDKQCSRSFLNAGASSK